MSINKFSEISSIFSNQPYELSGKLINKLFYLLCWFKEELSDDIFVHVVKIMLQFGKYKNIYSFNEENENFVIVSKLSHKFNPILDKYFDDGEIGTQIVKYINEKHQIISNGYGYSCPWVAEDRNHHFKVDNHEAMILQYFGDRIPIFIIALYIDHKIHIVACTMYYNNINETIPNGNTHMHNIVNKILNNGPFKRSHEIDEAQFNFWDVIAKKNRDDIKFF